MSPVCINEDLHYATQLHVPGSSMAIAMISFSLKTQAFVSYQIPDTSVSRHSHCETGPFNIRGKVGISFADKEQDNHKIWVLEDVKDNKWSLLLLNIHPSIDSRCQQVDVSKTSLFSRSDKEQWYGLCKDSTKRSRHLLL